MANELLVAPGRVLRGRQLLGHYGQELLSLGRRWLLVGGPTALSLVQPQLQAVGITPVQVAVIKECTEVARQSLGEAIRAERIEGVLACGGGKALDGGKLVAHDQGIPVVTIPTSAATCAAWTALSNVYSEGGAFLYDVPLRQCPIWLLLDYDLVQRAPRRTLVAGIGDALAKWYEASVSARQVPDTPVLMAVQQARVLRDVLVQKAVAALDQPGSAVWEQVVDATVLMAGLVGGLGGAPCRTVAAHAVHNGLTHWPVTHCWLHGEKVAFGILVQLRLEEMQGQRLAAIARTQLLTLYRQIGLPCSLADLGLGDWTPQELQALAERICHPRSDIHRLPFAVTPAQVVEAMRTTTQAWPPQTASYGIS
ncbi:MAG: iron-containing alcohol dehydrogenase family protein [Gloeomargarita sp. HHBFW_bins_205]